MLRLLRAQARRDRWQLLIWILGIGLLSVGSASAVVQEFGAPAERAALIGLAIGSPALLAVRGLPDGASSGALITFQIFTFLAVLAALMSTFLVVRHSRGDEERGRTELVGATPVARSAALTATILLGALANVGVAIAVAGGFAVVGLPPAGSVLVGLATGATGLAFCGIAALAAQVARSSRAANSIAGGAVAVAFLLRALGDALGTVSSDRLHVSSAWPSWLSPIGWGEQVRPFGRSTGLPLLLDLALFASSVAAAVALVRVRDLGSGVIGERPGRPAASPTLHGSFGLAWRLQRSSIIGWSVGAALLGLFAGGLADPAVKAVQDNAALAEAVRGIASNGSADLLDSFVAAIMAFLGVLAAGAAIQAVLRARSEESEGRAELVLAGAVPRNRVLLDVLAAAGLSVVIVLVVGGLSAGFAFVGAGHGDRFWNSLAAALVQLPAAFVFAAVCALVLAVIPRLSVVLGWVLLAVGFVLAEFGAVFKLPDWVRDVSPFSHTPIVPGPDIDWYPTAILIVVAGLAAAAAAALARRRDLTT
jgi:ABC-2 type transport system permease protein